MRYDDESHAKTTHIGEGAMEVLETVEDIQEHVVSDYQLALRTKENNLFCRCRSLVSYIASRHDR